jgi:hypothetical protein
MQEDTLSQGTQNWQPAFGKAPSRVSPSILVVLFAIAVLLMVALTSIEGAVLRAHRGEALDWGALVQGRLLAWGTCAAFVPPLYLLTTRLPIGRSAWWVAVPAHLVASILATLGKYTLFVPMARTLNPDSTVVWMDMVKSGFFGELMFYWAMIGLAHAVFYFTREPSTRTPEKECERQTATGDQKRADGSRITVSVGARTDLLILDELEWIAAQGNYILIYTCKRRLLVRHTLHGFASKLPGNFVRANRSAIVNLDRVERIEPLGKGKWRLHLFGGTNIPLGRRYKDELLQLLKCAFVPA